MGSVPARMAPPGAALRPLEAGRADAVLGVQRAVGNRATVRFLHSPAPDRAVDSSVADIRRVPVAVSADKVNGFVKAHPGYTSILAGFADRGTVEDAGLVAELLDRFVKRSDFVYTGSSKGGIDVTEGDCSTLVRQFVAVANECFGLGMTVSERLPGPLFVKGGGQIIHAGAKTGNVDHGAHWRFDDHVWAIWNGKPIDVLFGINGGLKASIKVEENRDGDFTADGTTYYLTDPAKANETYRYTSIVADRYDFSALTPPPGHRPAKPPKQGTGFWKRLGSLFGTDKR